MRHPSRRRRRHTRSPHQPPLADLRLTQWAHMLGFRGHFSTKSRRYPTTLGVLRNARQQLRLRWQSGHVRLLDGKSASTTGRPLITHQPSRQAGTPRSHVPTRSPRPPPAPSQRPGPFESPAPLQNQEEIGDGVTIIPDSLVGSQELVFH
ncbi:replication initiator [Nonomuraea sp. NPDC003727]